VQETFLKAWKSASQYRQEASKFKTWVLRIARNSAIDYLRKRKYVVFSEFENDAGQNVLVETVPDPTELQDELFARKEDSETLLKAVEQLSPEAREILLLHYTSGLTFQEIGDMLREPPNTVKSRHHRAIQSLKKLLGSPKGDRTNY
jgi:RNA polymerase sigma-70 factor (ECF subfamily)